jgi:hypothetical protein
MASVLGAEHVGSSIDAALIDSPSGSPRALPSEYPPIGTELHAVVQQYPALPPTRVASADDQSIGPVGIRLAVWVL